VTVNYRGTLTDGNEFAVPISAANRHVRRVSGVIKGWTEALQLMKVGSKYQLFIPANMPTANRATDSPNSPLIFEVELMD